MAVTIRKLHPLFVGEVTGVDLTQPLGARRGGRDRGRHGRIRRAGVSRAGHHRRAAAGVRAEFRRARGCAAAAPSPRPRTRGSTPGLADVSNLGKDGKPLPRDDRVHLFNLGNCLWHSDSSFRPIPAKFSLLSARVVNPKGGNTEFADMRAAYDALDDETKAEIEDMICEHSLMYLARLARLPRLHRGGKGDVQAGAAAAGAHPSGAWPQVAVSVVACRRDPGHDRAGSAACCCAISPSTRRSRNSSTSTDGRCMTS